MPILDFRSLFYGAKYILRSRFLNVLEGQTPFEVPERPRGTNVGHAQWNPRTSILTSHGNIQTFEDYHPDTNPYRLNLFLNRKDKLNSYTSGMDN